MDGVLRTLTIFLAIFLILELLYLMYPRFPRMPWDVNLDKIGIRFAIPIVSSIILSVLGTVFLGMLGR
jgi:hypothetical protein